LLLSRSTFATFDDYDFWNRIILELFAREKSLSQLKSNFKMKRPLNFTEWNLVAKWSCLQFYLIKYWKFILEYTKSNWIKVYFFMI
jgi:hypothetical protein